MQLANNSEAVLLHIVPRYCCAQKPDSRDQLQADVVIIGVFSYC